MVRTVDVDGRVVAVPVEEVRAGLCFLYEPLSVGGKPIAMLLDKGQPPLLQSRTRLTNEPIEVLGPGARGGCRCNAGTLYLEIKNSIQVNVKNL